MIKMQNGNIIVLVKDEDVKKQAAFEKHGFKVVEPKKKAVKKEQEADK